MLILFGATHVWHSSNAHEDGVSGPYTSGGSGPLRHSLNEITVIDDATADLPSGGVSTKGSVAIEPALRKEATYVVNEGGSLWRTGKRFIDDEVVLDRLIDKLADKGMNVRSVSAGVAFVVEDLGNAGLLVVFNDDDKKYTSHIFEGSVATLAQPQAEFDGATATIASIVEP